MFWLGIMISTMFVLTGRADEQRTPHFGPDITVPYCGRSKRGVARGTGGGLPSPNEQEKPKPKQTKTPASTSRVFGNSIRKYL